jgi:hypothetical protein
MVEFIERATLAYHKRCLATGRTPEQPNAGLSITQPVEDDGTRPGYTLVVLNSVKGLLAYVSFGRRVTVAFPRRNPVRRFRPSKMKE